MKDKLVGTFGAFGVILYYIVSLLISVLPFVMIGGKFFITMLLIGISTSFPITSIIFWIWGLICAITGPQDIWAIAYYIAFAVLWIPFFISILHGIFDAIREN